MDNEDHNIVASLVRINIRRAREMAWLFRNVNPAKLTCEQRQRMMATLVYPLFIDICLPLIKSIVKPGTEIRPDWYTGLVNADEDGEHPSPCKFKLPSGAEQMRRMRFNGRN